MRLEFQIKQPIYDCFVGLLSEQHMKKAAAAAKSLQSCPTLCDPIDGSPPGSPIPGILQARTLEWVAISFSMKKAYGLNHCCGNHLYPLTSLFTAFTFFSLKALSCYSFQHVVSSSHINTSVCLQQSLRVCQIFIQGVNFNLTLFFMLVIQIKIQKICLYKCNCPFIQRRCF